MFIEKREPLEKVLYPNQPLREVACEVRFRGNLSIESNRYKYQKIISDTYPKLYVPGIDPSVAPPLQHYRFKSEDNVRTVQIAINSIGFTETVYTGYESFTEEFFRIYKLATEVFSLEKITRIGWRYINEISFSREDGMIPLGKFIKSTPKLLSTLSDDYINIDMIAIQPYEKVKLGISIRSVNLSHSDERIILDIDAFDDDMKLLDINANEIPDHIENLHYVARNTFENFITEDYRTYLRGDTYE